MRVFGLSGMFPPPSAGSPGSVLSKCYGMLWVINEIHAQLQQRDLKHMMEQGVASAMPVSCNAFSKGGGEGQEVCSCTSGGGPCRAGLRPREPLNIARFWALHCASGARLLFCATPFFWGITTCSAFSN